MRDTDRRGFQHGRMLVEDLVDLARIDLESGDDDHLLFAVDDEEVAVSVHADDVAGVKPAIAEREGRLIGSLPVAVHEIGSAKAQLAWLARRDLARPGFDVDDLALDVRHGDADRARLALALPRIRV